MPKAIYAPFDANEIQKESDPEIQALVDQLLEDIKVKAGCSNFEMMKVNSYYTRCHGGNIHYIKVQTGTDQYAHITISKSFKGTPPRVVDALLNRSKEDPIEAYGERYE